MLKTNNAFVSWQKFWGFMGMLIVSQMITPSGLAANKKSKEEVNFIFPHVTRTNPKFFNPYQKPTVDYEKLKKLIKDEKIESIGELMEAFSKSKNWSKVLESPVFVRKSESLHKKLVDRTFPRVILHQDTLTLAFPSRPDSFKTNRKGLHHLEIFEFDQKNQLLKSHVIDFNKSGDERFVDNATGCGDCHGEKHEMRYNISGYPNWAGFYGANGGTLHFYNAYHSFREDNNDNNRVQYLENISDFNRVNNTLTQELWTLNALRIIGNLKRKKIWNRFKYAITGALQACDSFEDFLPDKIVQSSRKNIIAQLINQYSETLRGKETDETARLTEQYRKRVEKDFYKVLYEETQKNIKREVDRIADLMEKEDKKQYPERVFSKKLVIAMTNLRFVLEGQDYSVRDWSLSYPRSGYSYFFKRFNFAPIQFISEILIPTLLEEGSVSQKYVQVNLLSKTLKCDYIKKLSRDALN